MCQARNPATPSSDHGDKHVEIHFDLLSVTYSLKFSNQVDNSKPLEYYYV